MTKLRTLVLTLTAGILLGSAAYAGAGYNLSSPVPEPSDLALFALGVTGLIIGRWGGRGPRHRD